MTESPLGIVVIDDNESMANLLVLLLEDMAQYTVLGRAYDGLSGIELIKETKPDIVILDLCMPYIDGLGVMEAFQGDKQNYFPHFIITTCLGQEHITSMAMKLGAVYYMIKPLDYDNFLNRLNEIVNELYPSHENGDTTVLESHSNSAPGKMSLTNQVSTILQDLGVPAHTIGYLFLKDAICMVLQDGKYMNKITKNLYPMIAEQHDSTPSRVERAIRNSIELTLQQGNPDALSKCFGHRVKGEHAKLTNSEFIALLSEKIKVGN